MYDFFVEYASSLTFWLCHPIYVVVARIRATAVAIPDNASAHPEGFNRPFTTKHAKNPDANEQAISTGRIKRRFETAAILHQNFGL